MNLSLLRGDLRIGSPSWSAMRASRTARRVCRRRAKLPDDRSANGVERSDVMVASAGPCCTLVNVLNRCEVTAAQCSASSPSVAQGDSPDDRSTVDSSRPASSRWRSKSESRLHASIATGRIAGACSGASVSGRGSWSSSATVPRCSSGGRRDRAELGAYRELRERTQPRRSYLSSVPSSSNLRVRCRIGRRLGLADLATESHNSRLRTRVATSLPKSARSGV